MANGYRDFLAMAMGLLSSDDGVVVDPPTVTCLRIGDEAQTIIEITDEVCDDCCRH